jgi:4-amino-4-deoxy-L-arabinose transferase-like glycosyltransferase
MNRTFSSLKNLIQSVLGEGGDSQPAFRLSYFLSLVPSGIAGLIRVKPEALMLVFGFVIVLLNQGLQGELLETLRWISSVLSLVGVVVFLIAARSIQLGKLPEWLDRLLSSFENRLGVTSSQVIFLLFSLLTALTATFGPGFEAKMRNPTLSVTSWLLGIVLAVLGGWPRERVRFPSGHSLVLGLGFAGLAFLFRGIYTATIPVNLSGDEASMGIFSLGFLSGDVNNIFAVGWFSFPSLFYFVQSRFIALFGQTSEALRIPAAIVGSLTVGSVYLLARTMFGKNAAVFSAVFMTAFHYHIHFSRLGLNNIWDGLAFVITLGALWVGWQYNQRAYFLLAGFWLGIAQYLYTSSRVLFILIPVWILVAGYLDRERFRRAIPNIVLMSIIALVTIAPLAWYFAKNPHDFSAPFNRVKVMGEWLENEVRNKGISSLEILGRQIWMGMKAYTHEPIRHWYVPGTPILRSLSSGLFILGGALLAFRLRNSRTWLIALWLISFGFIAGLSIDAPAAQRYVAAAPAAAMLVGFGLSETSSLLEKLLPQRRLLINFLALLLIVVIATSDVQFYFYEYTPRRSLEPNNDMVAQRLANYLQGKSSRFQVYFFGSPRMGYYSLSSLPYLAPHVRGVDMNLPWGAEGNPLPDGDQIIFVFLPGHEDDFDRILEDYPGGQTLSEKTSDGKLVYWLYEISRQ